MSDFNWNKITLDGIKFPMIRDEEVCSSKTAISVKKLIIRTVIFSPSSSPNHVDFVVSCGLQTRSYTQLDVAVDEYNKIPN